MHDATTEDLATVDDQKRAIMEVHGALRRSVVRLVSTAWSDARGMTSRETIEMMRMLESFKNELLRHIKYAEVLVHPFVGEKRAEGLLRQHIADQRVVERALQSALAASRSSLNACLLELAPLVVRLFRLERALETTH